VVHESNGSRRSNSRAVMQPECKPEPPLGTSQPAHYPGTFSYGIDGPKRNYEMRRRVLIILMCRALIGGAIATPALAAGPNQTDGGTSSRSWRVPRRLLTVLPFEELAPFTSGRKPSQRIVRRAAPWIPRGLRGGRFRGNACSVML